MSRVLDTPHSGDSLFFDFIAYKRIAEKLFADQVQRRIHGDPILSRVRRLTIHEGGRVDLTRADKSKDEMQMTRATADIEIPVEQLKFITFDDLVAHAAKLAKQLADHQSRIMFEKLERVTTEFGQVVDAKALGAKRAFLEMEEKVWTDFDPDTLEPRNQVLVIHPSQREKLVALAAELDKDEEFKKELAAIRARKIEEWRARENSRKLVD